MCMQLIKNGKKIAALVTNVGLTTSKRITRCSFLDLDIKAMMYTGDVPGVR